MALADGSLSGQTRLLNSSALARARGGSQAGNGGFVEISSKGNLAYRGLVDTTATAGTLGTVLFDPQNITIVAGNGYGTADGLLPTIFSSAFAGASLTISQNALQNTVGDIILQATNDITIQPLVNSTLALNARATSLTLQADADNNGVGSLVMNASNTIATSSTGGSFSNLSLSGANLTLGTLRTAAPLANAGAITLSASGNITAGAIDTTSFDGMGFGYAGGAVNITAGGSLTVNSITTVGAQNAGSVTLASQGNLTVGNITANPGTPMGRQGGGGAIDLTSTAGSITAGRLLANGLSSGGNVTLQASGQNADITFTAIDSSASQPGRVGGSVDITAERFVRGIGFTTTNPSATITTAADSGGLSHHSARWRRVKCALHCWQCEN